MRLAFQIRAFPLRASAWLVATAISAVSAIPQPALADADRKPVVVDTQTGIQDGQSGVVLQSRRLARAPVVSGTRVAVAPGEAAQQPAIIVSPYIVLPAGASAPLPELRPHAAPVQ
jgi:hypothetical protein